MATSVGFYYMSNAVGRLLGHLERFEDDGADGIAKDGAVGPRVKGAYAAVLARDEPVFEEVTLVRKAKRRASGERELRLAGEDRLRRLRDGGERRGAREGARGRDGGVRAGNGGPTR